MFNALIKNLKQRGALADADIDKIISVLKVRHIKKKKNILSEGEQSNFMFFLNEGLCRYYVIDEKGNEQTIELVAEHNWFGDAKAFLAGETARLNIEALEDSHIFSITHADLNRFYDEIPLFERMVRKIIEQYFIKALERIKKVSRSSYSAQERYKEFLKSHPKLVNRVPLVYLSSYLGIAPETLSRLRQQFTKTA
ncbi:MAG: Crp/Fnr family transcriptional regulator [Bacteroidetes bacterium]|nr:Crp/Fnr family transcriptional regulator [Bacteroidota bacterium]